MIEETSQEQWKHNYKPVDWLVILQIFKIYHLSLLYFLPSFLPQVKKKKSVDKTFVYFPMINFEEVKLHNTRVFFMEILQFFHGMASWSTCILPIQSIYSHRIIRIQSMITHPFIHTCINLTQQLSLGGAGKRTLCGIIHIDQKWSTIMRYLMKILFLKFCFGKCEVEWSLNTLGRFYQPSERGLQKETSFAQRKLFYQL